MSKLTRADIQQALSAYQVRQQTHYAESLASQAAGDFHPAAVLMPLFHHEGRWRLLFTRRSEALVEHRGQVSFPGGGREEGDASLAATALRETQEEIGVNPEDVAVYGHLGQMPIVTGYRVEMYVGEMPWPYQLVLQPAEVESVFTIPLAWLADPAHRRTEYRSYAGREFPLVFFDLYEGHQLWGASAEMTLLLLEALGLSK